MFFQKLGDGPAVIILHGLFGSSDNWMTIARKLSKEFKVFLPDLRNHGRSPHSDRFDLASMSHDLETLVNDEKIGGTALVGHSLGGKVAMTFALNHQSVEKLIIVDVSPRKRGHSGLDLFSNLLEAMESMPLDEIRSRNQADQMLSGTIPDMRIRQFLLKNLFRSDTDRYEWRLNLRGLRKNLEKVGDGVPQSGKFKKPALFIRGEKSEYVLSEDETTIRELFPSSSIVTIPGAGHWVHAEAPEAVCDKMSQFLRN